MQNLLNKIHHADCLTFMQQLPDKCIDLVLTDPPFGMGFQSGHRAIKHNKIINDDNLDWLPEWCKEIKRVVSDNGFIFIFCSWHFVDVFKHELEKYIKVKNLLIWHKNNTGMGDLENDFAPQHELILFCNIGNNPLIGRRDSNILKFARTQNEMHPTQKPTDLIGYLAAKALKKGIVLDCFSGSGTTALACHDLGLDFICIEKDADYYKASVERLEKHKQQLKLF